MRQTGDAPEQRGRRDQGHGGGEGADSNDAGRASVGEAGRQQERLVSSERREEGVSVQGGDETVSIVMDLLGSLLPDEPQEGAQGPLAPRVGLAQAAAEHDIVSRVAIEGPESKEGVPEGAGP